MRPTELAFDADAIVASAGRAVIVTDAAGTIVAWNRAAERLYGWSEAEVLGEDVRKVLVPETLNPAADAIRATIRGGEPWQGDFLCLRKDGTPVPIRLVDAPITGPDGELLGIVGVSEDVTAERLMEAELRDNTAALRLSLEAGRLGTWRWDLASGAVVWDASLEELFGLRPGGFDGDYQTYLSLLHPDDRDAVQARVAQSLITCHDYDVEHRVVWPDGTVRWLQGRGTVIVDADGHPAGTTGCVGDVTDVVLARQRAEGAARQLAALAEAAIDIASSLSLDEVIERVTTAGRAILDCERVDIVMGSTAPDGTLVAPLGPGLGSLRCSGPRSGAFTDEDEAALVQLAHMATAAIDNARLYEAEQHARERNEELFVTVQSGLLPTLHHHERIEVSSRYRPGEERLLLGGDFLDAVTTPSGRLGFCIGDVSGHGPGPAAVSAGLRAAWRALALTSDDPVAWLDGLDRMFGAGRADDELFVTVLTGVVDAAGGCVELLTAGHPAPVLLGDGARILDVAASAPLGVAGDRVEPTVVELPPGWGLLFVTDGIYEGRARVGLDALVTWLGTNPAAGIDDVLAHAEAANGAPFDDDVAVLLLRDRP